MTDFGDKARAAVATAFAKAGYPVTIVYGVRGGFDTTTLRSIGRQSLSAAVTGVIYQTTNDRKSDEGGDKSGQIRQYGEAMLDAAEVLAIPLALAVGHTIYANVAEKWRIDKFDTFFADQTGAAYLCEVSRGA